MTGPPAPGELGRLAGVGWDISERATCDNGVWVLRDSAAPEAFAREDHDRLRRIEEASLWFTTRNQLIEAALDRAGRPRSLWDIGAGNGFVTLHLQRAGIAAVAVEPGPHGARAAADRGVREVVQGTIDGLELPDASLDAVGLFDVIEHLRAPQTLLEEVRRVVRPGGLVVATVPALPALWSDVDEYSGHVRRYRKSHLVAEFEQAGFEVTYSNYAFAAAVVPVLVLRVLRRRQHASREQHDHDVERQLAGQSRPVAALGRAVMAVERAWSKRLPVPFGTSALCVARR
jgi:SAM-dependent methyltransferase